MIVGKCSWIQLHRWLQDRQNHFLFCFVLGHASLMELKPVQFLCDKSTTFEAFWRSAFAWIWLRTDLNVWRHKMSARQQLYTLTLIKSIEAPWIYFFFFFEVSPKPSHHLLLTTPLSLNKSCLKREEMTAAPLTLSLKASICSLQTNPGVFMTVPF